MLFYNLHMLSITSSLLNSIPYTKHNFFSRSVVSQNESYSLNCNMSSEDKKFYMKSIANFFDLNVDDLKLLKQIHSNKVIVINKREQACDAIEADGLVTNLSGILLCIRTADCVPILFCDQDNAIIGAAHAGWKGAFGGVIQNVVAEMKNLGAKRIKAAIGPCIRSQNYEVDKNFHLLALKNNPESEVFFFENSQYDNYKFDLAGYCLMLLKTLNVIVDDLKIDTYSNTQLFFSYRKACHDANAKGDKDQVVYGNQISAIMIDAYM